MSSDKAKNKLIGENKFVFQTKLPNGQRAFVKTYFGNDPNQKSLLEREAIALKVLEGLAVPHSMTVSKSAVARFLDRKTFSYTAMEYLNWQDCFDRKFSVPQAIGLWVFAIEQICAFHRKEILYTDLKSLHLLVSDDLTQARIIDFGSCVQVEPSSKYPAVALEHSPLFGAPEFFYAKTHTERLFTYQAGLLLASLLQRQLNNPALSSVLPKIRLKLLKFNQIEICELLESCLAHDPLSRPKDIEEVLARILKTDMSSATLKVWLTLRAPFERELSNLGFGDRVAMFTLKAAS